jgi:HTH-type transcriptional regulator / antitoxin HipB
MSQIARTPKQIGDALRRRRRQLGLTRMKLGEKSKFRQATISAGAGHGAAHPVRSDGDA